MLSNYNSIWKCFEFTRSAKFSAEKANLNTFLTMEFEFRLSFLFSKRTLIIIFLPVSLRFEMKKFTTWMLFLSICFAILNFVLCEWKFAWEDIWICIYEPFPLTPNDVTRISLQYKNTLKMSRILTFRKFIAHVQIILRAFSVDNFLRFQLEPFYYEIPGTTILI